MRRLVRKTHIFWATLYQNWSFYQDRLGTNIGKAQNIDAFFAGDSSSNTFLVPTVSAVGFCGATLEQFQTVGRDVESAVLPSSGVSEAQIAEHARRLLEAALPS
jgi:hypothetical protein